MRQAVAIHRHVLLLEVLPEGVRAGLQGHQVEEREAPYRVLGVLRLVDGLGGLDLGRPGGLVLRQLEVWDGVGCEYIPESKFWFEICGFYVCGGHERHG